MKLSDLRGAIRKNPTDVVVTAIVGGVPLSLKQKKSQLMDSLAEAFNNDRNAATGMELIDGHLVALGETPAAPAAPATPANVGDGLGLDDLGLGLPTAETPAAPAAPKGAFDDLGI